MDRTLLAGLAAACVTAAWLGSQPMLADDEGAHLDRALRRALREAGFTGRIESTLEARLGRPLDPAMADLGRLLFFDKVLGLHGDNSCAGCHAPRFGFGDSQPMAIGVDNNDVVGPNRAGDHEGQRLPAPDQTGFHNFPIQDAVDARLNALAEYLEKFGDVFNDGVPLPPGGITISMRRRAIAEFQAILTVADAPLDRFARGESGAMTPGQKRGALLFFGKANCVACHAVAGQSNEMFSDFVSHRIGGPQLAPVFGVGTGNVIFDGPDENEDFGFAQTEGRRELRYMFRTAPLRNLKVAPAFFHNGAFGTLKAAITHHLGVEQSLRRYDPREHGVPPDLAEGPFAAILAAGIDPLLQHPPSLGEGELDDLVEFVREGLFDARVLEFCRHVPDSVPSGMPLQTFEGCE